MEHWMKKLACLLVLAASGCPDVKVDPDETGGPVVEFDPARSVETGARFLPFPNDLVRDPTTGKVTLGEPKCAESATAKATRENILNKLNGFGTYETALVVTFTAEVDMATAMDNVVLYQITNQGTALDAATAVKIPLLLRKSQSYRFLPDDCTTPDVVSSLVAVPMIPLTQKSTYVGAILKGVKDTSGNDFRGSSTWGLVNAAEDPVTVDDAGNVVSETTPLDPADPEQLAQLKSLDGLWKLHAKALQFLGAVPSARPRTDTLVAFQFTTQTTTDQLDPSVADSPAGKLTKVGFFVDPVTQTGKFSTLGQGICGTQAPVESSATQCFLKLALGGCDPFGVGCGAPGPNNPYYDKGVAACSLYGCGAIGDVLGGAIGTINYQQQLTNPWTNPAKKSLQGAWSDPVNPESQGALVLETLVVVPAGTMPANGWPTIIYGHGLTLSKETALTFAGQAALGGFATVAIDFSGHGSRAVRTSDTLALGCKGRCVDKTTSDYYAPGATGCVNADCSCETINDCPDPAPVTGDHCGKSGLTTTSGNNEGAAPTPRENAQCYDSPLSTDLAKTRDGFRQSVLDLERVVNAVKACGTGCGPFTSDPTKIFYTGVSLGGILGSIAVAESPDIKAAMLSVPGAGWLDLLENTDTVEFRCPLINGLIDGGVIQGKKWDGTNSDALCLAADKSAWQSQPGYASFSATGRWVLDPADPANFASKLATKRFMIQEVTGDTVVPNITTERLAALTGMTSKLANADMINLASPAPTASIGAGTAAALENKYIKYTDDTTATYVHSSLIRPAATNPATLGIGGTIRMQVDARAWLQSNK
jgi:pimeloyl-ACP methyl ester carboxylesterase